MRYQVEDAVAVLSRTPAVLDAWLRGLPDRWWYTDEGGETWSAFDVVGHLIHGEQILQKLRGWELCEAELARRGRHHSFGIVTLGQLLASWVAHDLEHLAQIARVQAKQYAREVGSWRQYLPILSK